MYLAQPKINLQSFKSTPDSLRPCLKAFERKRSLRVPDTLKNVLIKFNILKSCFSTNEVISKTPPLIRTPLLLKDVTINFSCKHCKFWLNGHWTENWGNLALKSTALPAGTESRHEFLVHEDLLRWSSLRTSRKGHNLVQQ